MSRIRKAWRVRGPYDAEWQGSVVFAPTAAKARYKEYLSASDHDDDLKLIDFRVRRAPEEDIALPERHDLASTIRPQSLACLMHATGLNMPRNEKTLKRNNFYTDANDFRIVELEKAGLMKNTRRGWETGSVYFVATDLGIEVARSCEPLYEYEAVA